MIEAQLECIEDSIASLESASLLVPLEAYSSRILALQYHGTGRESLGLDLLVALGQNPSTPMDLVRAILHDLHRFQDGNRALQVLAAALSTHPDDADLWHEMSAVQSWTNHSPEECLVSIAKAIELSPSDPRFRITASNLLQRMGMPTD
ncbi:MAG: hypothetical protein AAFP69_14380, partial [Planctomycetota bacterium]